LDWWGWVPIVAILATTSRLPAWIGAAVAVFSGALLAWGTAMVVVCKRSPSIVVHPRLASVAGSFRAGLDAFASRRTLVLALLIAPLPWAWEAGALTVASRAFEIHLTFPMALCVLVGFNAATVVPAPGGIGPLETGGAAALLLFGVDHTNALAFLVVYHLTQLLPATALGAMLLALKTPAALIGARSKS
jgi:uncharacterized membrane protein YbhN (UPF0104 family)